MHRVLVILALCVSYALAELQSSQYLSQAVRSRIPNVQLNWEQSAELESNRRRRDITVHPLEDPKGCLVNCSHGLKELRNVSDTDSDEKAVTQLCQIMDQVEKCYKTCPTSQFRSLLLDFMPTMKMPCLLGHDKFSELKKVQNCLNSTDEEVTAKCEPACNSTMADVQGVQNRIIINMNPPFIMYDNDKKANTLTMRSTCKFLVCTEKCAGPIMKAKCGQTAIEVDRKITASVFGSIIKLYTDIGALDSIPECQPLTQ